MFNMKVTIKHKKSGVDKKNFKLIDKFILFLQDEFPLKKDLVINFVGERVGKMTTGSRRDDNEIFVLTNKRIIRDILRTLSHEWVHEYQITILKYPKGKNIGGKNEDMANAESGSLIKKFEKKYPKIEKKMYE